MRIITKSGLTVELAAEELRHFKINTSKQVREFIDNLDVLEDKSTIGFKGNEQKEEKK